MALVTKTTVAPWHVRRISLAMLLITLALCLIFAINTLQMKEDTRRRNGSSRVGQYLPPHQRSDGFEMEEASGHPLSGKDSILLNERKIRSFVRAIQPPAFLGGHAAFVQFPRGNPVRYVNIMREPLDRLISHYYFNQNGDSVKTERVFHQQKSTELTLDECIRDIECKNIKYTPLLMTTVSQLCGTAPLCRELSREAMLRAKSNLKYYVVIGLKEELNTTVLILETMFPNMLAGLHAHYKKSEVDSIEKFKTISKTAPSPETSEIIRRDLALEYELYEEAKRRFATLKRELSAFT
ncbi:Heparan sulfate 2-O-sulfotransferase hst-2 [Holothuria leucospilota]|uniref:Heparan sulfate 2-O-sulfotransferase hst-2 n=1 Tax=Holothuria leucospilota TaxID=206669 RepID=A0A9Q0YLU6_HOLLE|nr:Heparan sulfate 2-O-sulfotransferase hst-2 [Holothuria leucospilota]